MTSRFKWSSTKPYAHQMESQLVGGVRVSHELHNTMPLSVVITRVQRNLLRVQAILFGVRLLHEYRLARLLDVKCTWTKS